MNPLVSFGIITYNQEQFILDTLKGAVSQEYDNMEIIVSDVNSTDKTFEIVESFVKSYEGPFKFILNKNKDNLRIAGNVNKVIELSHGDYIILADGDDISLPNRVKLSVEKIDELGVLSMTFNMNIIDSVSRYIGPFRTVGENTVIFSIEDFLNRQYYSGGASRVIKRKIVEQFGYLNQDCQTEDSVFNFRAFLTTGLGYCSIPMVNYRVHDNNISSPTNLLVGFDPKLIYKQYKKDLDIAQKNGIINKCKYDLILRHLVHHRDKEEAIRKIYIKKMLVSRLAIYFPMIFSNKYSLRTKLSFLKTILSWKINKF